MSFFKKLFSSKAPDQSQEIFFRPRPPRVRLTEKHQVKFIHSSGRELPLANVSIKGMAVCREQNDGYAAGNNILGKMLVDNDSFNVDAKIRFVSNAVAGCEFMGETIGLRQAIERYFRVEILGLNLRPVDKAFLKPDPAGEVSWFTDGRQNEVYCVTDDDGIVSFHISFLGNYIEGGRTKPLCSGYINEDASTAGPSHKGSALLAVTDGLSTEMEQLACALVDHVEKMPSDLKEALRALMGRGLR